MYICQFINNHFIRNFNKFRGDEALKTRWGKWDTLDCHMGVTWFDAARWLAASRRLIIFYQNIFKTRSTGWSYNDLSDITWNWWRNKLCISFSKPRDFANGPDLVAQSTDELHVGLGYKASCSHGLRTWQLTQQATCPSFARNHRLE